MPKTSKQLTQPELQPQPPQMPSARMEIKKPKAPKRLWLLSGVLVLVLIVIIAAAWQASKSSPSTKTTTQATQLAGGQVQATHDMDHVLSVEPAQPTHDMDHTLQASSYHANHPGGAGPQPGTVKCVLPQVRPSTLGVTNVHTWCPPLGYHANYPGGAGPQPGAAQSLLT